MLPAISTLPSFKISDSGPSSARRNRKKSAKKQTPFRTSYFSAQKLTTPPRTVSPLKTPNAYGRLPTIRECSTLKSTSNEFDGIFKHIKNKSESRNSEIVKEIESVSKYAKKLTNGIQGSSAKPFSKTVSYASKLKQHSTPGDRSQSVKKIVSQDDTLFKTEVTAEKYFDKAVSTNKLLKKMPFRKRLPIVSVSPERYIKFTSLTDRKRSSRRYNSSSTQRINSSKDLSSTFSHNYISELERISVIKSMPTGLRKSYLSNILLYKSHINLNSPPKLNSTSHLLSSNSQSPMNSSSKIRSNNTIAKSRIQDLIKKMKVG